MRALPCLLIALLVASPAAAGAGDDLGSCLHIERVTAFAPRRAVYVEVHARCSARNFEQHDPIVAYLEVLVGEQSTVGEDVRVHASAPRERQTFEFRELPLEHGQPLLVRLMRFGEILRLQSITVP